MGTSGFLGKRGLILVYSVDVVDVRALDVEEVEGPPPLCIDSSSDKVRSTTSGRRPRAGNPVLTVTTSMQLSSSLSVEDPSVRHSSCRSSATGPPSPVGLITPDGPAVGSSTMWMSLELSELFADLATQLASCWLLSDRFRLNPLEELNSIPNRSKSFMEM